ncbi:endonuclease/exonuclease/phosphatase family protein [Streptomyces sp. NPDC017086]|uniref:endonuclease/exonuclease/phosphatase family protein n=1 Tax=Streptomyces sp. NPDC017086 TaxID=3364976 RepID=UPI0037AD1CA7
MSAPVLAEDGTEVQPPRPRWGIGSRSVVIATGLWITFLAAHLLLAGRWWVWLIVETMPPITLVVVPLTLLVCARFARPVRRRAGAALVAALLAGAPFAGLAPAAAFGDNGSGPRTGTLKVFSWNTDYWHMTDDVTAFYAYLRAQHADVYLLQEYLHWDDGPVRIDDLTRLRAAFPGYRIAVASELVTMSRIPLVGQRLLPASDTDWRGSRVLRTDVRYGSTVMSLYNVHLAVPVNLDLSPLTKKFYRYTHDEYRRRQTELTALRADLARNPLPRLVAGDRSLSLSIGAFSLAAVSGMLVIFLPDGAVVRELLMAGVLVRVLPVTAAATAAIASRALCLGTEILLTAVLLGNAAVVRKRRAPANQGA